MDLQQTGLGSIQTAIAMGLYMLGIIGIGLYYARQANKSTENYFLGGRSLGPWVTALSAEASDMSGWLLMGLPGVAYWCGLADAFWTAIGLGVGTYINWLITAKRLRVYSHETDDAITIPDFLSRRYCETKPAIMLLASVFILIFFTVYASSCFVTVGKLFSFLFNQNYIPMMILGAVFVVAYTGLGGFLAESVSDFVQGIVMIIALVTIVGLGVSAGGGFGQIIENAKQIPGFWEFFTMASPVVDEAGAQVIQNGAPVFGDPVPYPFLTILSTLSWGLGYFGVPQVLLRFMAVEKVEDVKASRRIATVWVFISLGAALFIGIMGRVLEPTALSTPAASESVFIVLSQKLLPPFLAGIILSGILAATISSADSYLLIAASAVSKNIYQRVIRKEAKDHEVMRMSRIVLIAISVFAMFLATDENSVIFQIVSFAWAGFGAVFGPVILTSLFSSKTTHSGAFWGMVAGGAMVFIWKLVLKPMGGVFGIYELLPAFLISLLVNRIVSAMTKTTPEIDALHAGYLKRLESEAD